LLLQVNDDESRTVTLTAHSETGRSLLT